MNQPAVDPARIRLTEMKLIREFLESSGDFLLRPRMAHDLTFGHRYLQVVSPEQNRVKAQLFLSFKALDDSGDEVGLEAEYGLEFHFTISNLADFIESANDREIKMKGALTPTLAGIAYSTSRGVVWEKMARTHFSNVILPVVDPNDLVRSMS